MWRLLMLCCILLLHKQRALLLQSCFNGRIYILFLSISSCRLAPS